MSYRLLASLAVAASLAGAAGAQGQRAEPVKTRPLDLGSVLGSTPAAWLPQQAQGQFRVTQMTLPKAEGDPAAPQFIVFYFGPGQGGSVEDNLTRWRRMMQQPVGVDAEKAGKVTVIQQEGVKITALDVSGTYLERPFPASPDVTPRPNYRMLAAVVEVKKERADGPYYLRVIGPAKGVGAAAGGWDGLLKSLKAK